MLVKGPCKKDKITTVRNTLKGQVTVRTCDGTRKDFSGKVDSDLRPERYTSNTKGRDSIGTFKGGRTAREWEPHM